MPLVLGSGFDLYWAVLGGVSVPGVLGSRIHECFTLFRFFSMAQRASYQLLFHHFCVIVLTVALCVGFIMANTSQAVIAELQGV